MTVYSLFMLMFTATFILNNSLNFINMCSRSGHTAILQSKVNLWLRNLDEVFHHLEKSIEIVVAGLTDKMSFNDFEIIETIHKICSEEELSLKTKNKNLLTHPVSQHYYFVQAKPMPHHVLLMYCFRKHRLVRNIWKSGMDRLENECTVMSSQRSSRITHKQAA